MNSDKIVCEAFYNNINDSTSKGKSSLLQSNPKQGFIKNMESSNAKKGFSEPTTNHSKSDPDSRTWEDSSFDELKESPDYLRSHALSIDCTLNEKAIISREELRKIIHGDDEIGIRRMPKVSHKYVNIKKSIPLPTFA